MIYYSITEDLSFHLFTDFFSRALSSPFYSWQGGILFLLSTGTIISYRFLQNTNPVPDAYDCNMTVQADALAMPTEHPA